MNAIALSFDRRLVPSHVGQSMNSGELEEREQLALRLGINELWEIIKKSRLKRMGSV